MDKLIENENQILKTEIVYIKEIQNPTLQSILRPGDQILEINGISITNLDEARQRLDNPLINEFNILFSRLNAGHDHKLCEQRIRLKKQKLIWLKQNAIRNRNLMSNLDESCLANLTTNLPNNQSEENEYDNDKLQNKDEKDSGLGKTDQESVYTRTNETCSSNDYDTFNSPAKILNKTTVLKKSNSSTSLEKEILQLNKEMENIKFECEMLNRNYQLNQNQNTGNRNSSHIPTKTGQLARQLSDLSNNMSIFNGENKAIEKKESIKKWIKNGLVGLNGKSNETSKKLNEMNKPEINCKSNRISSSKTIGNLMRRSGSTGSIKSIDYQNDRIIKHQHSDCPSEHEYAVINYENAGSLLTRQNKKLTKPVPPPLPPANGSRKNSSNLDAEDNDLKIPSVTMYTNKANLQQTILLQQQLLRQALEKKQLLTNSMSIDNMTLPTGQSKIVKHQSESSKFEKIDQLFKCKKLDKNKFLLNNSIIKLKKKSDGTKYISKKLIVDAEPCRQRIINCNKNLINHDNCKLLFRGEDSQKIRKTKEVDCKHLLKTKISKKTNEPRFFNGLKPKNTKSNQMKLQDNLVLTSKNDIFTVATV